MVMVMVMVMVRIIVRIRDIAYKEGDIAIGKEIGVGFPTPPNTDQLRSLRYRDIEI